MIETTITDATAMATTVMASGSKPMPESANPPTAPTNTLAPMARPVTAEIATVPVAPSPHRALTTAADRLSELHGPPPSSAITGITKNGAIAHAAPAIHN